MVVINMALVEVLKVLMIGDRRMHGWMDEHINGWNGNIDFVTLKYHQDF